MLMDSKLLLLNKWDTINVGDRIVSRDLASYMRSRNIRFSAQRMKPKTRLYAFMDGVDVTKYCCS